MEKILMGRIFPSLSIPYEQSHGGRFIFLIALSLQTARARGNSLFQAPFPISFHSFGTKKREREPLPPFFRDAVPPFTLRGFGKTLQIVKRKKLVNRKKATKNGVIRSRTSTRPRAPATRQRRSPRFFAGAFPKASRPKSRPR